VSDKPNAGDQQKPVYECIDCGQLLYEGDTYVPMGYAVYCTECAEDQTS
jgi:hypothetical protein